LTWIKELHAADFHNERICNEVHMKKFDSNLAPHFDQLLSARECELCAMLDARDIAAVITGDGRDVTDFKDLATRQCPASVDEAQAEQAAHELEQVLAARRRMKDHAYGNCLDCDRGIDPARLAVMPATAYCAECQSVHECKGPVH
jgi:DnaK suppressor protein